MKTSGLQIIMQTGGRLLVQANKAGIFLQPRGVKRQFLETAYPLMLLMIYLQASVLLYIKIYKLSYENLNLLITAKCETSELMPFNSETDL